MGRVTVTVTPKKHGHGRLAEKATDGRQGG